MLDLGEFFNEELELASLFESLEQDEPELRFLDTDVIFFHVQVDFKFVTAMTGVLHELGVGLGV